MGASAGSVATLKVGTSASPTNQMGNGNDYDMPAQQAMYDVSAMGNTWQQYIPGLKSGKLTIKGNYDMSDTNGQVVLRNAFANATLLYFILSPDGTSTATFTGYVSQWHPHAPVNNKVDFTAEITVTGAVVYA